MGEQKEAEVEYRRPLLSSRQIGMIAAFGGLGFAWRALGAVIPLFPPYVLDIRESILVISAFAGGPYVAIGVGILIGLPSSVPYADVVYYPMIGILLCIFTKYVWRTREEWNTLRSLVVLAIVLLPIQLLGNIYFNAAIHITGVASFWPEMTATVGGVLWVYWLQEFIPLWLCIKIFPEFMRPIWSWRGGEEIEE